MWLQATINALYDAGVTNDTLNLLYLENKNAQIAIKINNKLTKRILVKVVGFLEIVGGPNRVDRRLNLRRHLG